MRSCQLFLLLARKLLPALLPAGGSSVAQSATGTSSPSGTAKSAADSVHAYVKMSPLVWAALVGSLTVMIRLL